MNKKEIIREILGRELTVQGYEYVSDDESYVFRKWEAEILKEFVIGDIYQKSIRIDFMTNVNMGVDATKWVDRNKCRVNELGFLCVLPTDVSTPEMEKEFYENREQLIEQGVKLLGIEGMTGANRIHVIIEKLKELQNKTFQDAISELILLSAVWGSVYCEMTHGEWRFDGTRTKIVNESSIEGCPLKVMISIWKGSTYEVLINNCVYAEMQHNLIREERTKRKPKK
ncbi:MAG: hypothetical protein J6K48_05835 [Lachnospiraceae bacterium]|nr:hypothetical protein [Lachnospiraceae bacterium]